MGFKTARELRAVELVFQGKGEISPRALFKNLYGNEPITWSDDLRGIERLRLLSTVSPECECSPKMGR